MGNKVSLEEELINLRIVSKQMQRSSKKCEKNEKAALEKLKKVRAACAIVIPRRSLRSVQATIVADVPYAVVLDRTWRRRGGSLLVSLAAAEQQQPTRVPLVPHSSDSAALPPINSCTMIQ